MISFNTTNKHIIKKYNYYRKVKHFINFYNMLRNNYDGPKITYYYRDYVEDHIIDEELTEIIKLMRRLKIYLRKDKLLNYEKSILVYSRIKTKLRQIKSDMKDDIVRKVFELDKFFI